MIQAQGTPSSTLFSFSAGLFSIVGQSPECCQDSEHGVSTWRCHSGRGNRLWHVHMPVSSQDRASANERLSMSILFAESTRKSSPRGRSFSAAPVLLLNGKSGSRMPFFGTSFSLFCFLLSTPRFLLQMLKMPTSSYRLTMPGWQLMTSEPSKSNAFKSSYEKGGKNQSV